MADEAIDGSKASQPLNDPVFTIAKSDDMLWQGDILYNCPYLVAPGVIESGKVNTVDVDYYNVIVITQTCDIKDRDVKLLLVAPVMAIGDYIDQKVAERKNKMDAQNKPVFKNDDEEKGFIGSKLAELRSYKLARYHYIPGCTIPGYRLRRRIIHLRPGRTTTSNKQQYKYH